MNPVHRQPTGLPRASLSGVLIAAVLRLVDSGGTADGKHHHDRGGMLFFKRRGPVSVSQVVIARRSQVGAFHVKVSGVHHDARKVPQYW